jgi:putative PIN family toxin of toxin-antitoxin system
VKLILDTNVLVSGISFAGVPGRLLEAWRDRRTQLVVSPDILDEYQRVGEELAARYPTIEDSFDDIFALIAVEAELVAAPDLPEPVSEDPADDKFLACALVSGTQVVVSGDKHLLRVSGWGGISVLTPRQCYDRYLAPGARG